MSRFAKLVQAQEERKATPPDSQLSTTVASERATDNASPLPPTADRQHAAASDRQLNTETASSLSTSSDTQMPPASMIATTQPMPASQLAPRRVVDSRRRRRVDSRKGDRHRGDKVPFNNRLNETTVNRIRHFCVDHNIELQEFAELAAIHFMDAVDSQTPAGADSKQALDDRGLMMLYKTEPSIINLYLSYNPDNRWKPADDYEAQRYNDKDIRLLEIGIIQTQFNARFKKVNSFKYYTTEIDIALETPLASDTVDIMLKQGRKRWQEATGRET